MTRIVVLGTGTGVGKTFVTAQLATDLTRMPFTLSTTPVKPVESGIPSAIRDHHQPPPTPNLPTPQDTPTSPNSPQHHSDASLLARAASPPMAPPRHAYAFEPAISPHLAARLSLQSIDLNLIKDWVQNIERTRQSQLRNLPPFPSQPNPAKPTSHRRSWLLIETAGAAFSPLSPDAYNLTLAQALDPAIWLLVAPDRLGVLHDLKVTLHTMRTLARLPDCVVLSQPPPADLSTGSNADELQLLDITSIITVLQNGATFPDQSLQTIWDIAERRGL